jgi:hypothetical protein
VPKGLERARRLDTAVEYVPTDGEVAELVPIGQASHRVFGIEVAAMKKRGQQTQRMRAIAGPCSWFHIGVRAPKSWGASTCSQSVDHGTVVYASMIDADGPCVIHFRWERRRIL